MSAIGTASSYGNDISALIRAASPAPSDTSSPPASAAAGTDRGPATQIQLSDKVKAILARANADQDVAERLRSFVAGEQGNGSNAAQPATGNGAASSVDVAFQKLTASQAQLSGPDDAAPVQPATSFSKQVNLGGFSISVSANATTGSFGTAINGPNGVSFFDKRSGMSSEISGFQGLRPGLSAQSSQVGNVEYVTFTQNDAAAASVTATSGASSISKSAAAVHSGSVTIAIDFTSGSIQLVQTDALATSTATQINRTA